MATRVSFFPKSATGNTTTRTDPTYLHQPHAYFSLKFPPA